MLPALLMILICIALAFLLGELFKIVGLPRVIGQISAGLVLGIGPVKEIIFGVDHFKVLSFLANLGIILLFFYIGLELNLNIFKKNIKKSMTISIFKAFVPLILGYVISTYVLGFNFITSMIIAVCLAAGAQSVSIDLLEELKLLKTKLGTTIVSAGIITDVIELLIITVLIGLFQFTTKNITLPLLLLNFAFFIFFIFLARLFIIQHLLKFFDREKSSTARFTGAIILVLAIVSIAEFLNIGALIGAVVAGIVIRSSIYKDISIPNWEEHDIARSIHIVAFGFLIPLFFVWVGLNTNLGLLSQQPFLITCLVVTALFAGIGGTILGNVLSKGSVKQGIILGFGLSPKGDIGFVIGALALEANIITDQIFSSLVLMALIVTIISPIVFKKLILNYRKKNGRFLAR